MKMYKKNRMASLPALMLVLCLLVSCSSKAGVENPKASCTEDLAGHRVGCLAGSLSDLQFDEYASNAEKMIFNTEPDLLAALDSRKVDFIVFDSIAVVGIDKSIHNIEISFSVPGIGGDIGTAFRKDDVALCRQYNDFLAQIKADGTYSAMLDRWFSDAVHTSEMPDIEQYTDGEVLKVGELLCLPFCFIKNGDWVGMEVEMMKRFAAYLHRPIEIKAFEFSSLMAALKTGVVDVWCSFITINEERSKEVLFSDPYFYCPVAVFRRGEDLQKESVPFFEKISDSFHNNLIVESRWKMLVDGIWETLVIALFSLLLGTVLGGCICALRRSKAKFLSGFAQVYVEILRGIPMLVFLMVMFYVVLAPTGMSGRWVAIISFAINFSAYTCEIFRTGIDAVDKGQKEAGLAMGFTPSKTFLFFIMPQAVRNILPVFKNEAVSLIKGTSIVGYVAIQDLTKMGDIIRSRTFDAFFPLIVISIIYFIIAWLFGKALDLLSKKLA
ncbi:MAG: ABC transporter substrate-binding protein/permease [Bacteroidales bacterium]|nr:ABC transporter substrate-binding protein/permease [Bacteroidales bacterium]